MKLSSPTHFCIIYCGQQADSTDGAQASICGSHSYLPLDVTLRLPAEDMIDDIGEEWHDNGETQHPNPRSFPTMKTGFQKFERKLKMRIIRQQ